MPLRGPLRARPPRPRPTQSLRRRHVRAVEPSTASGTCPVPRTRSCGIGGNPGKPTTPTSLYRSGSTLRVCSKAPPPLHINPAVPVAPAPRLASSARIPLRTSTRWILWPVVARRDRSASVGRSPAASRWIPGHQLPFQIPQKLQGASGAFTRAELRLARVERHRGTDLLDESTHRGSGIGLHAVLDIRLRSTLVVLDTQGLEHSSLQGIRLQAPAQAPIPQRALAGHRLQRGPFARRRRYHQVGARTRRPRSSDRSPKPSGTRDTRSAVSRMHVALCATCRDDRRDEQGPPGSRR
jgi:hypothetical protein